MSLDENPTQSDCHEFLTTLFPDLSNQFIELRLISMTGIAKSVFLTTTEQAALKAQEILNGGSNCNLYFGVCPRKAQTGNKESVVTVNCLWADVDGKDFEAGKTGALARVQGFFLKPTCIVDSGNGYHCYWLLKEPSVVGNKGDRQRLEAYLLALAEVIGGDSSSAELARVLRLPGSINLKNSEEPKQVAVIELRKDRQFNLQDFDLLLDGVPKRSDKFPSPSNWLVSALEGLRAGNRNSTFAKLTGKFVRAGFGAEEVYALLEPHAVRTNFPLLELRQEVEGICGRYSNSTAFPSTGIYTEKTETDSNSAGIEVITVTDLLSGGDFEIQWCVEKLVPVEAVAIISGPGGHGKTWLLLDMAESVATGSMWLGKFRTEKGRVLYLDEESSLPLLRRRISRLLSGRKHGSEDMDMKFCVAQGITFSDPGSVTALREVIREVRPSLIIVDSLIRFHSADENSASEMSRVFEVIKGYVRMFKCSFVIADHQRKPGNSYVSPEFLLRGSTDKAAFVDSLISIQKKDDNFFVTHSKSRFAIEVKGFVVKITDPTLDSTTVSYQGESEALEEATKLQLALEFLSGRLKQGDWTCRRKLVAEAKGAAISEKVTDKALKRLLDQGQVDREMRKAETGRGGKAAFYRWRSQVITSPSPSPETETETELGFPPREAAERS